MYAYWTIYLILKYSNRCTNGVCEKLGSQSILSESGNEDWRTYRKFRTERIRDKTTLDYDMRFLNYSETVDIV